MAQTVDTVIPLAAWLRNDAVPLPATAGTLPPHRRSAAVTKVIDRQQQKQQQQQT